MARELSKTRAAYQKARQFIPYGVNSNFRYWGPENTLVVSRGEGPYIWDLDGNRYIDYRLGFGPVLLGHAHPVVTERVAEAILGGTIFAWTTPAEVRLAEQICRITGVDKVRLANSGTEATMHALRLARAYTGRERFVKFEGQYHGMHDYALFSTASSPVGALGSRHHPIPAATSSGIPVGLRQYVVVQPFNDLEILERTLKSCGHELAAIMVEPVLGNAAGIPARPGFLQKLREWCDEYGIVLIFDEVKTGFRIALGGAQEYFGVRADLVTYAKAMGNGFPIAAIGGSARVMDIIEGGGVAHGGTYTGNAVGVAAAEATLGILESEAVIETIYERGQALSGGIDAILNRAGIPHCMTGLPPMFSYILGQEEPPQDFRAYCAGDDALYEELVMALIEHGVMPDCDGREPWFLCYGHDEEVIAETLTRFEAAVKEVRSQMR
ncbi:MAG: aspartate aminotransferase family protein [Chloroflexia bacterium]|nr:aspartate aminotransferase family protein [Chloroflexia bacterium]